MNYYNENDSKAAAWLRSLIADGHIAAGVVDERSILDVRPYELSGFTQQHFFAGIGGWSHALRLAGWPDSTPVRTGSCPCQPFSVAGEGKGEQDERHLWPWFRDLITFGEPTVTFGEQVAGAMGIDWMDNVSADLEGRGYEVGAAVLPACGYGADHERKRLFWVAHARSKGRKRHQLINSIPCGQTTPQPQPCNSLIGARGIVEEAFGGLLPDHGLSVGVARSAVKGFGNAIVPWVAAEFIQAYLECLT
jgi:DNA (cytosine-5)-methyltransferase 1